MGSKFAFFLKKLISAFVVIPLIEYYSTSQMRFVYVYSLEVLCLVLLLRGMQSLINMLYRNFANTAFSTWQQKSCFTSLHLENNRQWQ